MDPLKHVNLFDFKDLDAFGVFQQTMKAPGSHKLARDNGYPEQDIYPHGR